MFSERLTTAEAAYDHSNQT